MNSDDLSKSRLRAHVRILGTCWTVYGIICLISALWMFFFTNTATLMFGALLNRVPNPFALMDDFHILYSAIIVFSLVCGIVGFLAGLALLTGQRFGRWMALIASFLSLSSIPLGTTLGIYSLIVLLPVAPPQTSAEKLESPSSSLKRQPVPM